jgi:hypothetical protein
MKKLVALIVFCLATYGFAFAQSKFPELDKIKQIKLLESTREDVKRIFDNNDEESDGEDYSTDDITIYVHYSSGNCGVEDEDEDEAWNVPEGKVTEINVILKDPDDDSENPKELKIDLSKLDRIKKYEDEEDEDKEEDANDFVYYDKENGVSYGLSDGKIKTIKFTPLEKNLSALCNTEELREFNSPLEYFREHLKRHPSTVSEGRPFANVDELILSKNEITADCPTAASSKTKNEDDYFKILIETKAASADPTDVLTYNYTVSGGKVIGTGASVTWDLSGVKSGKYTITAGVDNGCGVCGMTKTQEVVIKEYPDCKPK